MNEATAKRVRPNKTWGLPDVDYVYNNYGQMTVSELADKRKLAPFQVNQIISGLRKRNILGKKRELTYGGILNLFQDKIKTKK